MITKCYFDDDMFTDQNGRTMIISDDICERKGTNVKIEVFREGSRESVIVVNGKELAKAIKNCTGVDPWGEF